MEGPRLFTPRYLCAIFALGCVGLTYGEPPEPHAELSALEQQQASFQKQRASIERQLAAAVPDYQERAAKPSRRRRVTFSLAPSPAPAETETLAMPSLPLWQTDPTPLFAAAPQFDCPALSKISADGLINSEAQSQDISADLLRAVIRRESAFRPCAVSEKGAAGLMQLMPATAEQFGVVDPFNPEQNIRGGASFLKQLLKRFGGDVRLALGAYNAGPERVAAAGGIPGISETQNYVAAIAQNLNLPESELVWATPEANSAVVTTKPPTPVTNAMTKPDLRHLTLTSAALTFNNSTTAAH